MKTNAIIRICIYSLLILLLLGFLLGGIGVRNYSFRSRSHEETYAPRHLAEVESRSSDEGADASGTSFPATVTSMEISWAVGNITIQSGDVEKIYVSIDEEPDEEPAKIRLSNGTHLSIDFVQDTDWYFGLNDLSEKGLTITVPRDLKLGEIELDIASAQVELRGLTVSELDIDGASGTCVIENCDVNALNVDTASGDVKFYGSLRSLDFDAASADFVGVFDTAPRSLKIDSMSGDLDITLPQGSGFTASIDAMNSRFTAEQECSLENGAYVHGDGACRIEVDGMSGEVIIRQGK